MPWSAKHIAPQSSLAMKTARAPVGGNFSWGGQAPTPPVATAPAVNPQANQRTDAEAPRRGPPTDPTLKDSELGSRYFGRIDPNLAPVSKDKKMGSAAPAGEKTAAQALQERVGVAGSLTDSKLGSRGPSTAPSVNPGSLIQASTFKSPYAPQFLTDAVTNLNETNSYTSMMHDEWRNTLLRASEGNASLSPALAAASVQPGAHFSLGFGGGYGGSGAPTQRQPSYFEQKVAFDDLQASQQRMKTASEQSRLLGIGLGTFQSQSDVTSGQGIFKADYEAANQSANLARKVLNTRPTGKTAQAWDSAQTWGARSNVPSGWW